MQNFTNTIFFAKFHSIASKNGHVVIHDSKLRNMGFLFPNCLHFMNRERE